MDTLIVVIVLAGVLAVAAQAVRVAGRPSLSTLFRWREPGWPRGVQEDDDARWQWRPRRQRGPTTEPVRGRVHAASGPGDGRRAG